MEISPNETEKYLKGKNKMEEERIRKKVFAKSGRTLRSPGAVIIEKHGFKKVGQDDSSTARRI